MSTIVAGKATSREVKEAESNERSVVRNGLVRRWVLAGAIVFGSLLAVGFVANAIEVNQLLEGITAIERDVDLLKQNNERLRVEIMKNSSVEQVTLRASSYGLELPESPPRPLIQSHH